jgi:hypothetical protein
MMHEHFRQALETLDAALLRKIWAHVMPNMPQPASDEDTLKSAHYARTLMDKMPFKLRAYSHQWLMERGLPSGLPDHLRPSAQRLYPVTVMAVGVAVKSKWEEVRLGIQSAMNNAVLEAEGDGKLGDSPHVKRRMSEARERERKALGLRPARD